MSFGSASFYHMRTGAASGAASHAEASPAFDGNIALRPLLSLTLHYVGSPRLTYVNRAFAVSDADTLYVSLEGPLVLSRSVDLKDEILTALRGSERVCLDVAGASEIDLSFLQILIAAHKTAKLERRNLTVAMAGSEKLAEQIFRCGLPASVLPDFRNVLTSSQQDPTA